MRNDHKIALKKVKQQISAFCLRHGYRYDATVNQWTQAHLKWLRALKPEGLYRDILMEYLSTYDQLTDKIERMDRRIEELAGEPQYREGVKKLSCFLGIKIQTALSTMVEVWRFQTFFFCPAFCCLSGACARGAFQQ